jgi:TonB family protein
MRGHLIAFKSESYAMALFLLLGLMLLQATGEANASSATPPTPKGPPGKWATDNDYPPNAVDKGYHGTVHFTLVVDPTGKPESCHITWTSGFAQLDQYSCAAFLKRARFNPARDAKGQPIRGTYSNRFRWELPDSTNGELVPAIDLLVEITKLPKGYAHPVLTRVHFAKTGKPDACRVEAGSGNDAIDKLACEQVMIQAPAPTERFSGGARPDTRMVLVTFEASGAK